MEDYDSIDNVYVYVLWFYIKLYNIPPFLAIFFISCSKKMFLPFAFLEKFPFSGIITHSSDFQ